MAFYKRFVRGSETLKSTPSSPVNNSSKSYQQKGQYSGKDAKSFYDQIVGLSKSTDHERPEAHCSKEDIKPSEQQDKVKNSTKDSVRCRRTTEEKTEKQLKRLRNDYLKHAQEGDLAEMKRVLAFGVDMNHADLYGWTALMCAAFSGHGEVVKWLLTEGADASLTNNQNKTAADFAKNRSISRLFSRHTQGLCLDPAAASNNARPEKFYCDICKKEFTDTTQTAHITSTIHLFNRQEKPQTTHYYIPPANKGFQLMVKGGWEPEKGLGAEGQGRKFPVKTVLKRDRQGIGGGDPVPAKVTHFKPNDVSAVTVPVKERTMRASTMSKKQRKKKLSKERAKERDFRLEFYSE